MSYIDLTTNFDPGGHAGDGPYPHCQAVLVQMWPSDKIITVECTEGTVTAGAMAKGDGAMTRRFEVNIESEWDTIMQAANTDDAIHQWLIDKGHAPGTVVNS